MNNSIYIPEHIKGILDQVQCSCELISVLEETISRSVVEGFIPLVYLNHMSEICIQTTPLESQIADYAYIAISHIWADSLGNPMANTIHLYQAKLLQERVDALATQQMRKLGLPPLTSKVPFWMDTLCVPATDGPSKVLAIASIEKLYKTMAVLVLDRDLTSMKDLSDIERAVRIAASPWWTRLWTVQEGAFAKELYFQFQDRAVLPRALHSSSGQEPQQTTENEWITRLLVRDALSGIIELPVGHKHRS